MDNIIRIIKEAKIEKRKEGGYRIRITIEGMRKAFYGKTKVEVKNKIKEYLMKIENGYNVSSKILLNDYIEYWLTNYKLNKIEPSSYLRLWRLYKSRIQNSIGLKMLGDINNKDIQRLIDDFANPKDKSVKPLARSGLFKIKHLLNPCFKMAIKENIIKINPCEDITIPVENCIVVGTKEQFSLNEKEIELFKEGCIEKRKNGEYKTRNGLMFLILLNLGLRIGELTALKWSDVDFTGKTISINKIMQTNIKNDVLNWGSKENFKIKKSSKTKNGVRVLPLNEMVEYYLQEIKEYDGRNGIQSEYIACTNKGKIGKPVNYTKALEHLKKRKRLNPDITLHTLRHTFGSHLIKNGISVEVVSKLMGHSSITITYDKYIHVIQEEKARVMDNIKIC